MTPEDLVRFWEFFLHSLRMSGEQWITDRDGILAGPVLGMWEEILARLLERSGELGEVAGAEDQQMLCQIVWGIGAWDPDGPYGGIGGGVPGTFVSARMIKEAVERWLAPRLSQETRDLLKALNQLLCMLRCL